MLDVAWWFWRYFPFACGSLAFVSPFLGEPLFFAPPKKSSQKKGGPTAPPAVAGILRFSGFRALAQLAAFPGMGKASIPGKAAQTGGSLTLEIPAMLGGANGTRVPA